MDGLAGICSPISFLPQYFTKAILLGALHENVAVSIREKLDGIKSCSVNIVGIFDKDKKGKQELRNQKQKFYYI